MGQNSDIGTEISHESRAVSIVNENVPRMR